MENHSCSFCDKPVTEAAYNYCVSHGLPVACYKCQYDKDINIYSIHQRMRHKGTEAATNMIDGGASKDEGEE
ncbi:hypothetical protein [Paenibacillus donghaensis]|uniref:Uncharacterized protein n=1 Tax=Paenibacillus donghaensis TaxID=414771 RepID=A0A2Z2K810_9BACL|nr:hypothetical protein [Paenibacillus donghaensis]ASA22716.1 hypothetical protein B9T62_19105 [Paenibacillus donghaensis]